jgi:hypothetical protein
MQQPGVLRLVFGEQVEASGSVLRYRNETFSLGTVAVTNAVCRNTGRGRTAESLWTLPLQTPMKSVDCYLRVRFRVADLGSVWLWKRGLLFKRIGAKVDFRVVDPRETSTTLGTDHEARILPIEDLYLFLIAPWELQARSYSPSLKYTRVLEGRVWARYLQSAITPRRSTRLVVYYWRAPSGAAVGGPQPAEAERQSVSPMSPFRAFLDLSREYGPTTLLNLVLTLLVVIVGVRLAPDAITILAGGVGALLRIAGTVWGIVVALGLAALGVSLRTWARSSLAWIDTASRELDRLVARLWQPST